MKCKKNDMVRRISVRAVVAYPVVSTALVVSFALALTSFGPSQAFAVATAPSPTATTAPTATTSTAPPVAAAPSATTSMAPPVAAAPSATTSTSIGTPSPIAIPSASSSATSGAPVDHHVLALIEGSGVVAHYLAVDAPMTDLSQFQSVRMRFSIHNAGAAAMTAAPQLEYRLLGSTDYTVVPQSLLNGIPFRVDREWVPSGTPAGGTKQSPLGEDIAVNTFRTGKEGGGLAMIGHHSMGANPDRAITLPSDSYTEQEFTVLLTMDAQYLSTYEFRITNGRTVLAGTQVATIRLGAPPALKLSPDQHKGAAVEAPRPARSNGVVR